MVELFAYRVYGQPKISNPKELKGIKPVFSQRLNKSSSKCHVYINKNDVYVYFFDLFSKEMAFPCQEDASLPTSALAQKYPERLSIKRKGKFCYADGWRTVFERNEGYVKFTNLLLRIGNEDYLPRLQGQVMDEFSGLSNLNVKFENISQSYCQRWADYSQFINDMICKLKTQFNSKY